MGRKMKVSVDPDTGRVLPKFTERVTGSRGELVDSRGEILAPEKRGVECERCTELIEHISKWRHLFWMCPPCCRFHESLVLKSDRMRAFQG